MRSRVLSPALLSLPYLESFSLPVEQLHRLPFVSLIWLTPYQLLQIAAKVIFFFLKIFIDWLVYWLLCWVFVSVLGLSLVAASGGHSSSRCAGLSLSWPLLLRSTGSRRAGSVVVAHGPNCSAALESSQTRARTRVPCIGRQILNHCATREAQKWFS